MLRIRRPTHPEGYATDIGFHWFTRKITKICFGWEGNFTNITQALLPDIF